MENTKQFLKDNEIVQRISFKDGTEHIVEMLNDKINKITDDTGKEIEGVKYLVRENGELRSFFTSSIGLMTKLADLEKGDKVGIKMVRKKGDKGYRSHFEVRKIDDDDIPVVEDGSDQNISSEEPDYPSEDMEGSEQEQ